MQGDIDTAKVQIQEAQDGIKKLRHELSKLEDQVKETDVSLNPGLFLTQTLITEYQTKHKRAKQDLDNELATLTRFDSELKDLEETIKEKKAKVSDADLKLKQLEHDIQQLNKDKTAATHKMEDLEKQYEWIEEEQE